MTDTPPTTTPADIGPATAAMLPNLTPGAARAEIAALKAGAHIQYDPLLPIRPVGSQPPLFCVHPGGGLALIYKNLADTLDPDIPVTLPLTNVSQG